MVIATILTSSNTCNVEARDLERVSNATNNNEMQARVSNWQGGLPLEVHCKSKDNDLGVYTIADNENFLWSFRPNIRGTTLFYCNVSSQTYGVAKFQAYNHHRDKMRCTSFCAWLVRANGVHGFNQKIQEEDMLIQWEKPAQNGPSLALN
ncbi:hypothetical protein Dimus_029544 [Dionaea muscipula]